MSGGGAKVVKPFVRTQIVHISTSHSGGAGIAASRLHEALLETGLDSQLLTLEKTELDKAPVKLKINPFRLSKYFRALTTLIGKKLMQETYFTLVSIPSISGRKLAKLGDPERTIFHIHNWFNFMSLRTMGQLLRGGYQVIFTLHDQRLFTGGCHYSLKCKKYEKSCVNCELLPKTIRWVTWINKIRVTFLFQKYGSQITIVAPSIWIHDLAAKNRTFKKSEVIYIPNLHRVSPQFKLLTEERVRNRDIYFGLASVNKNSPLKGSDITSRFMLAIQEFNLPIRFLFLSDFPKTPEGQNDFWSSIDYLFSPSRADNSPNVIHEAKLAGIPVVGSNVGGIPELLNSNYDYVFEIDGYEIEKLLLITSEILSKKQATKLQIRQDYLTNTSKVLGEFLDMYARKGAYPP